LRQLPRLIRALCCIAVSLIGLVIDGSGQSQTPDTNQKLSLEDRIVLASGIYSAIPMYFGHMAGVPNLDLDREYRAYVNLVLKSDSRRDFDMATMEFIAKLGNGHTWFGDWWLRNTLGQSLGFYAHPIDGEWTVTETQVPDLRVGSKVTAIDGEPIEAFYARNAKYLFASDEHWRRRQLFESPYLFPLRFKLQLSDRRDISVVRTAPFAFHGTEFKESRLTMNGDIPVVVVPSFANPAIESSAIEHIKNVRKAQALVLDLRGNHGGSSAIMLLQALMTRPYHSWAESTPAGVALFQSWGVIGSRPALAWGSTLQFPRDPIYSGPLFILVDDGCYSACEDFVQPFRDNGRAKIIGERTAGSSGQAYIKDFGNGMALGLSVRRETFPDGRPFEGMGIIPDIEVHLSASDTLAGRDPVMAQALALAKAAPE